MAQDPSSANWKIDRAVELLDGLDSEVIAWQDTKPYSFYTNINPGFTRATVNVKEHNRPQIIRWSLIVADIIHNLRCALDHSFWAVLQSEFPTGLPNGTERLSFPIWDHPPNANRRLNFQPLGRKICDAVESVQPYNHPDTRFPVHPLAIIRDIDNANKHKLLFTVMSSISMIRIKVSGLRQDYKAGTHDEMFRGELKDGVEAAVTSFPVPQPDVKYECTQFAAIIAIRHPTANRLGQDRDDYAALIDALIEQVRSTITDFNPAVT